MSQKACGIARHFQADVEAFLHAQFVLGVGDELRADVDGQRRAHAAGQLEPIRIHVGDDDIAGPGMTGHRGRHDADRPRAGHKHVLAQHGKLQRRMDCVAEWIENRLRCRGESTGS